MPAATCVVRLALRGISAPSAATLAGWLFPEMGRRPFVVAPNPDPSGVVGLFMFTAAAVSPGTAVGGLLFSVISLTAVYGVMLVIEVFLLVKYIRGGTVGAMPELVHHDDTGDGDDRPSGPDGDRRDDVLAFAY